jgi:hypothetical protein
MKSVWTRSFVVIAAATLVLSFQNCAPPSQYSAQQDSAIPTDEHAITSQKIRGGVACQFENLSCLRKVYSPEIEEGSGPESMCVNGSDLCLEIMTHTYDTAPALKDCPDCGPEATLPGGQYNRDEYTCWLGEPGAPQSKIFALRSSFEDAVQATLNACGGEL